MPWCLRKGNIRVLLLNCFALSLYKWFFIWIKERNYCILKDIALYCYCWRCLFVHTFCDGLHGWRWADGQSVFRLSFCCLRSMHHRFDLFTGEHFCILQQLSPLHCDSLWVRGREICHSVWRCKEYSYAQITSLIYCIFKEQIGNCDCSYTCIIALCQIPYRIHTKRQSYFASPNNLPAHRQTIRNDHIHLLFLHFPSHSLKVI